MEEPNSSSGEETEDDEETMSEMFMNSDSKLCFDLGFVTVIIINLLKLRYMFKTAEIK